MKWKKNKETYQIRKKNKLYSWIWKYQYVLMYFSL